MPENELPYLTAAQGETLADTLDATSDATIYAVRVSVNAGRIVFAGPTGTHALWIEASSKARVLAHWAGFIEATRDYLKRSA